MFDWILCAYFLLFDLVCTAKNVYFHENLTSVTEKFPCGSHSVWLLRKQRKNLLPFFSPLLTFLVLIRATFSCLICSVCKFTISVWLSVIVGSFLKFHLVTLIFRMFYLCVINLLYGFIIEFRVHCLIFQPSG